MRKDKPKHKGYTEFCVEFICDYCGEKAYDRIMEEHLIKSKKGK